MNYRARQNGYMYRRKNYSRRVKKTKKRNWAPLLFFLFILGVIVFVLFKLVGVIFDNVRSEPATAEIQVLQGKVEYYFAQQDEWTAANSGLKFLAGDAIRTSGNSKASLQLFTGNTLFLNHDTEIIIHELEGKSSGKKEVGIELRAGQIWVKTSPEEFGPESDSLFYVFTDRAQVNVTGTIFDLERTEDEDILRLVRGNVNVDIAREDSEATPWNIEVEVGQKLPISNMTTEKLRNNNTDVKEIVDSTFIESDWHIQNIEQFFPQEAAELKRRVEMRAPQDSTPKPTPDEPQPLPVNAERGNPEILTPQDGAVIPATRDTVEIEGSAPENTMQIVVNGYTLTRFNAGDRKWRYFASTRFGTLVPGGNEYSVVAVFRDGQRSEPATITVTYEGVNTPVEETEAPVVPTTETPVIQTTISDFKAPVVTKPAAITAGEKYQTSAEAFTIVGIVDPKTNRVVVNGYELRRFRPGDTEFRYTVNSKVASPNLIPGDNNYTITAFGPDGKEASTTVTVVYTPMSVSR